MSVQKFRNLDDARRALWMHRDDPHLPQTIRALWAFAGRLTGPLPIVRGLQKFRTIEEANASREAEEKLRVAALRQRRAGATR